MNSESKRISFAENVRNKLMSFEFSILYTDVKIIIAFAKNRNKLKIASTNIRKARF